MEEKPDNYLGLHSAILIALGLCISIQVSLTFFWESQWAKMKQKSELFLHSKASPIKKINTVDLILLKITLFSDFSAL